MKNMTKNSHFAYLLEPESLSCALSFDLEEEDSSFPPPCCWIKRSVIPFFFSLFLNTCSAWALAFFWRQKQKKGDSRGSRHLRSEAVILLSHLPVSPAQTNKAVPELYPSYPVTLLRILSFFVVRWAFVEEKIIVWASVAAVWLLWCDIQRLRNCQMNSFADLCCCSFSSCTSFWSGSFAWSAPLLFRAWDLLLNVLNQSALSRFFLSLISIAFLIFF